MIGNMTLFPYMNARDSSPTYDPSTAASFSYTGTVTLKWGVEVAGTGLLTDYLIFAEGVWGGLYLDHKPIAAIIGSLPGTTTPYASKAAMIADIGNIAHTYGTWNPADSTPATVGTYALVGGTDYYYLTDSNGTGPVWVPLRVPVSLGTTASIGTGLQGGPHLCNLYTVDIDTDQFPSYNGQDMAADQWFNLCWALNSRHGKNNSDYIKFDAYFYLTPITGKLQSKIMERAELNARVAGEKARDKDEMIARGQLEAGTGITIRYRDREGQVAGYGNDPVKGYNIIIEQTTPVQFNVGVDTVNGINLTTGAPGGWSFASDVTTGTVRFSDEPIWVYDVAGARTGLYMATQTPQVTDWDQESLPVTFRSTTDGNGTVHLSGRVLHNGLFASHNTALGVVQKDGAPNNTIGHLQFKDTADVTFTVTEMALEGTLAGYRWGLQISADVNFPAPTTYSWIVRDALGTSKTINNGERLDVSGANGVSAILTGGASPYALTISRPLTIEDDGVAIGGVGTTIINFDSNGAPASTTPVLFTVTDIGSGERNVKGFVNIPVTTNAGYYSANRIDTYNVLLNQWDMSTDFLKTIRGFELWTSTADLFWGPVDQMKLDNNLGGDTVTTSNNWVKALTTGVYHLDFLVQGMSNPYDNVCTAGRATHNMEIQALLYIRKGSGAINQGYCMDHECYNFIGLPFGTFQDGFTYPGDHHRKWSLQGSCNVYLETNDEVQLILSAISYVNFPQGNGLYAHPTARRHITINYGHMHLHVITTDMTNNVINAVPIEANTPDWFWQFY